MYITKIKAHTFKPSSYLAITFVLCHGSAVASTDSLEMQIRKVQADIAKHQKKLAVKTSNTFNPVDTTKDFEDYRTGKDTGEETPLSKNDKVMSNNVEDNLKQQTIDSESALKDATQSGDMESANASGDNVSTDQKIDSANQPANNIISAPETVEKPKPSPKTPEQILAEIAPPYHFNTSEPSEFMQKVNTATWYKGMRINQHTTLRIQVLLDWNHASPGPIDTGWGMNSRKAIRAFEQKHGLKVDGKMDAKVWTLLNQGQNADLPALVKYTITKKDVRTRFRRTPKGYEAKAKQWQLGYNNIYEMFGERFHMSQALLKQLNKGIKFRAGNEITVVNIGRHNTKTVDNIVVDKRRNILYAYNNDTVVATYPTTIGDRTPKSGRTYTMVGKVFMPTYKAETKDKRYILPPGPNNPVGVAWMALSKPTFGIHGSPLPEGISRQRSHGCVRLTNWDATELFATIKKGARVRFK